MYHAVIQTGICPTVNSSNETITVSPVTVTGSITGNEPVCSGSNTGILTLGGYSGSVQTWLESTDLGNSWTTIPNNTALQAYFNLTTTTWYAVIVQSGICAADTSMAAIVSVKLNPVANISIDTVCYGKTTTFNQTSSIGSGVIQNYIWDFGDFSSYSSAISHDSVHHTYSEAGVYPVSFTVTSDLGCVTTVIDSVLVGEIPNSHISSTGSLNVCFGGSTTLSVITGYNYTWNTGETTQTITVDSNGVYSVIAIDPVSGCLSSDSVTVKVLSAPAVTNMLSDTSISLGTGITLNNLGGGSGVSYSWSPAADLNNPNVASPIATPKESTIYTLTITDANGCTTTDSMTVTVNSDFNIKIPNLITPNGDGQNDSWIIKFIENYHNTAVIIVNVEGKVVYQSSDYQNDWKGTNMSSKQLPDATYYYFITNPSFDRVYKGAITVIKDTQN